MARRVECGVFDRTQQPFVPHGPKPTPPTPPGLQPPGLRPPDLSPAINPSFTPPLTPNFPTTNTATTTPPPIPFNPPTPVPMPGGSTSTSGISAGGRAAFTGSGALAGGALGYGAGRALTSTGGYSRVATAEEGGIELEGASADIETGVVEVGSRAVNPPGLRFRGQVGEEAETRVTSASQRARNLFNNLKSRTSSNYERVSTVDEEQIEMEDLQMQSGVEAATEEELATESAQQVASANAEVAAQEFTAITSEAAPELAVMPEAAVGLTEVSAVEAASLLGDEAVAEGGAIFAESLGLAEAGSLAGEGAEGIELADLGATLGEAGAAVDAGAEVGGAVATAEAAAAPFDVETLGLAAVGAGIVGAVAGGLAAFFGSQHKSSHSSTPRPGFAELTGDSLERARNSSDAAARSINAAQSNGVPIYAVTTQSNKGMLVAQLTPTSLARAQAALTANPTMMYGHDPFVLQAMGLNPSLATAPYSPNSNAFAPRITPPSPDVLRSAATNLADQGQRAIAQATVTANQARIAQVTDPQVRAYLEAQLDHYKWHNGLITGNEPRVPPPPNTPESIAALQEYNERVSAAAVANSEAQISLADAQYNLDQAQSNLATTQAQSQADYAAFVTAINSQRRLQVDDYNSQLMSGLHSIADEYSREVADINIDLERSGSSQLLGTNIRAAMQAAQLTYTPYSTTIATTKKQQELAAARRMGLNDPTTQEYRRIKQNFEDQGVRGVTQQQVDSAVQAANTQRSSVTAPPPMPMSQFVTTKK